MTNNRGFTEAVPLSLSSMAHMTMPLEDGVSDGLTQVLNHLLLSCVSYARAVSAPYKWTARDLTTSKHAWEPHEGDSEPRDLPTSLTKHGFQHQYHRTAFIYLRDAKKKDVTLEDELAYVKDWAHEEGAGILGRITLLFATTGLMTPGELNGSETNDDTPKCVLYKVILEYRSLPATGNKAAVQAEELSMLSFGGSVDDDVKYGALASLYDDIAKYILEIYSVRGKKYKFDLMNSTLCDGTVPRLPSRNVNPNGDSSHGEDPFLKSLCVTVTDHATSRQEEQKYAHSSYLGRQLASWFAPDSVRFFLHFEQNPRDVSLPQTRSTRNGSCHAIGPYIAPRSDRGGKGLHQRAIRHHLGKGSQNWITLSSPLWNGPSLRSLLAWSNF
jgi:hypothetical protein